MAERDSDTSGEDRGEAPLAVAALDPSAAALAMEAAKDDPKLAAAAADYFRKQSRLVDLQAEHLHEQRQVTLSQMKLVMLGLRLKVGLQVFAVVVAAAVGVGLAAMVWNAARDHRLVVEALSVPPDLAARGVTGQALASQLLDRLGEINAKASSIRAPSGFAADWGQDVKVEIPDTGVSIGELDRFLRRWLGHETHITGELMRTSAGLALTVRAGETPGRTLTVQADDMPGLLQQAAASVFEATQPYRFSMYLLNTGHPDQALQAARRLAEGGPISERAWAWTQISNVLENTGDAAGAARAGETAATIDPQLGLALINEANGWAMLGRSEMFLKTMREGVARLRVEKADLDPVGRQWLIDGNQGAVDELLGDRRSSAQAAARQAVHASFETFAPILQTALAYELALNHDVSGSLQAYAVRPMADADVASQLGNWDDVLVSQYERAAALDDWTSAVTDMQGAVAAAPRWPTMAVYAVPGFLNPRLATAFAHAGRLAEAEQVAASLPGDCYRCLVARGDVEALAGHWDAAARWFAEAVRQAPSIPMAETQWGAMLLARGDVDGAMAKFALALGKGPHYADPRELWGEALIRKGDFAGAALKFAAVDKDAPRWGRNHMRWGEALARLGKADEARAQWRAAAGMDLSSADRAELARVQAHG